jgi:hypothetical protein
VRWLVERKFHDKSIMFSPFETAHVLPGAAIARMGYLKTGRTSNFKSRLLFST